MILIIKIYAISSIDIPFFRTACYKVRYECNRQVRAYLRPTTCNMQERERERYRERLKVTHDGRRLEAQRMSISTSINVKRKVEVVARDKTPFLSLSLFFRLRRRRSGDGSLIGEMSIAVYNLQRHFRKRVNGTSERHSIL